MFGVVCDVWCVMVLLMWVDFVFDVVVLIDQMMLGCVDIGFFEYFVVSGIRQGFVECIVIVCYGLLEVWMICLFYY